MLVSDLQTLIRILDELSSDLYLACDTETTGLSPYKGDRLFAIILSNGKQSYFLNFNLYDECDPLGSEAKALLRKFFADPLRNWIFSNAKFDLAMLWFDGYTVAGKVYDLMVLDRLHYNLHHSYSLDAMAKRWGEEKLDTIHPYCKKQKLFTSVEDPELNKQVEMFHYERVPLPLMLEYACRDGLITYRIFEKVMSELIVRDETSAANLPKTNTVLENECRLTKSLLNMELHGIKVDVEYCKKAVEYYSLERIRVESDFQALTGEEFALGPIMFKKVFADIEEHWEYTPGSIEKNRRDPSKLLTPSFDAAMLEKFDRLGHPVAKLIMAHRGATSQIQYFQNFLWFKDENDRVHTTINQNMKTGRTSSSQPNLQNLTRPDDDEEPVPTPFPVRKAFIPASGFFFAMLDYKAVEFRILLDKAKARTLIQKVLEGLDVHTATALIANVTRSQAKTVNFLTVYGGGKAKLAADLGVPVAEATRIQNAIFGASPEIKDLIEGIKRTGRNRGYIYNYLGRQYHCEENGDYRLPNHYIQGTAADIIKQAINRVDKYLADKHSRLILLVHDELILEVKEGEEHVVEEVRRIMESVYTPWRLPLLASADFSRTNLAEKEHFQVA